MMLKTAGPARGMRAVGMYVVSAACLLTGVSAWGAKPARSLAPRAGAPAATQAQAATAQDGDFLLEIGVGEIGSELRPVTLLGRNGRRVSIEQTRTDGTWKVEADLTPLGQRRYSVQLILWKNGAPIASPRMLVNEGEPAAMTFTGTQQGNIELRLRVAPQAELRAMNATMRQTKRAAKEAGQATNAQTNDAQHPRQAAGQSSSDALQGAQDAQALKQ